MQKDVERQLKQKLLLNSSFRSSINVSLALRTNRDEGHLVVRFLQPRYIQIRESNEPFGQIVSDSI